MIEPFLETDIASFLAMATGEGWICERWEFDFMLQNFPQGCSVWRDEEKTLGYITSISYGGSGWIGNLLVHSGARSRGIGRELMKSALSALMQSGVKTVWLTASEQGADLYRSLGFIAVDHVHRWTGTGTIAEVPEAARYDLELVRAVDRGGWGDRRDSLLQVTCGRGRIRTSLSGFVCCQTWQSGTQIGPWGCLLSDEAEALLDQALVGAGEKVFLDVPAGNHPAAELLAKKGFAVKGSNVLMYLGDQPRYEAKNIYALASMGSMG